MYGATKSAAESLARSWADAFGGKDPDFEFMAGTTSNSIMVGLTDTDAMRNLPEGPRNQLINEMTQKQNLPRAGQPEDVADVVGLICREESRWMTGASIPADGGAHQIL